MALMVSVMTVHGIVPGPQVMIESPHVFWGMIATMWIGNLMLLDDQSAAHRHRGGAAQGSVPPAVPDDPGVLRHRHVRRSTGLVEVLLIGRFGVVGYLLIKIGFEPAPLLLGVVLGRLMEENLRRAMIISRGDMMTFVERADQRRPARWCSVILLVLALLPAIRKGRDEVFVE